MQRFDKIFNIREAPEWAQKLNSNLELAIRLLVDLEQRLERLEAKPSPDSHAPAPAPAPAPEDATSPG